MGQRSVPKLLIWIITEEGDAMHREEATGLILEAKKDSDLTFEAIADKIGRHKVWTTAWRLR